MNKLQHLQEEDIEKMIEWMGRFEKTNLGLLSLGRFSRESIINTLNEAFKLGQLSGIELSEGCIPEEKSYKDPSGEKIYYQDNLAEQFNKCRTESLTNISDLKQKIQHE